MTRQTLVFLVQGFFGFTSVGAVSYFRDAETALDAALRKRGVTARIVRCATQPTASILRRADRRRRQVLAHGGLRARRAGAAHRRRRLHGRLLHATWDVVADAIAGRG